MIMGIIGPFKETHKSLERMYSGTRICNMPPRAYLRATALIHRLVFHANCDGLTDPDTIYDIFEDDLSGEHAVSFQTLPNIMRGFVEVVDLSEVKDQYLLNDEPIIKENVLHLIADMIIASVQKQRRFKLRLFSDKMKILFGEAFTDRISNRIEACHSPIADRLESVHEPAFYAARHYSCIFWKIISHAKTGCFSTGFKDEMLTRILRFGNVHLFANFASFLIESPNFFGKLAHAGTKGMMSFLMLQERVSLPSFTSLWWSG